MARKKLASETEIKEMKKMYKNGKSIKQIFEKFKDLNLTEKTIRNYINSDTEEKDKEVMLLVLKNYNSKDTRKILIEYYSKKNNWKESTVKQYLKINKNEDSENNKNNKEIEEKVKKEWKKIIKFIKNREDLLIKKVIDIENDGKVILKNKNTIADDIIEKEEEYFHYVAQSEKEILKALYIKSDEVYEYIKILSILKYSLENNDFEILSDLSKHFKDNYIKNFLRETNPYKYKFELNFHELFYFFANRDLKEKEIIILLSKVIREVNNSKMLDWFYSDNIKKSKFFDFTEKNYIEYCIDKTIVETPNQTYQYNDEWVERTNETHKENLKRKIKTIRSGKSKRRNNWLLFAIPLKLDNKKYNYIGDEIHKILFTILINMKKEKIKKYKELNSLEIYFRFPNYVFDFIGKNFFKKKSRLLNYVEYDLLRKQKTYREYFKEILCLKEDIPNQYDTFEKLLNYIHKLEFDLDGNYNREKELELALGMNEAEIMKRSSKEILDKIIKQNRGS